MSKRLLLALALVLCACGPETTTVAPVPVTATVLSGATYNVVVKNADESVILLGQLAFAPIVAGSIAGTWRLAPWGSPGAIPGLPGAGTMAGTLEGSRLLLRLQLPAADASLGLLSDGFVNGRLAGRISLLPTLGFDGRFEAIRAANR